MSESPLRDWIGSFLPRPAAPITLLDEHDSTRAPGQFGHVPSDRDVFQRQSATQENNLLVTLFSAFDATIALTGLIHRPNNQFTPIGPNGSGFVLSVKGDRTLYQYSLALGSSIAIDKLNAVIASASVNAPVNACWVIVQQTRPQSDGTSVVTGTLLSGPVTLLQPLAYPGSPVQKTADSTGFTRLVDVANPAPGQELTITVPAGARWQVNTMHFQLVTSATAGSREILLRYTSGATITPQTEFTVEAQGSLQGPSQTCQYAYGFTLPPTISTNFGTGASSTTRQQGLPGNRFLLAGEAIVTQTANLAAGDQFTGIVLGVTEVLDPTAPAGTLQPIVTFTGPASGSQNLAISPLLALTVPGTYTLTVNQDMSVLVYAASGGGGGGGTSGMGSAGGGGGGAVNAMAMTLRAGKSYRAIVAAGGTAGNGTAKGGDGGATSFTNTTDAVTLIAITGAIGGVYGWTAGGVAGDGINTDSAPDGNGGVVTTGAPAINGGRGGGGADPTGANPSAALVPSVGQTAVNGCGAGGGGGGTNVAGANGGDGGNGHGNGGAPGVAGTNNGGLAGGGGPSGGAGLGGGGGGGGGFKVPGLVGGFGGGGGGGSNANPTGAGQPGIVAFAFVSAP